MSKKDYPKIDFVVTWVDGSDPEWQKEKAKWAKKEIGSDSEIFKKWINNDIRFRDWDIFKYWFRAVEKYAPWVNKVYLITNGQVPKWLDPNCKKLQIVKHDKIIPKEYLPTFNSNAIELNMHKIKGLSEHFVYFNDDMFLNNKIKPSYYFKKGLPRCAAVTDCAHMDYFITHAEINNTKIINRFFDKRDVLKKNPAKWFNLRYGKYLIKTISLLPWKKFTGMQEFHVAIPYLKSTFSKVAVLCDKDFKATMSTKFRKDNNINHWLVENWQMASGDFYPISPNSTLHIEEIITDKVIRNSRKKKYKVVCYNDVDCENSVFRNEKRLLHEHFQSVFPEKSKFEK